MAAATGLAVSLDDWVCASARPVRLDILESSRDPGTRRDYSDLSVEDAFPLLIQACKTRFGDLRGLDFGLKESSGPLAYSAALTITGPDDIGIEFPNSGQHPTKLLAKMHAAHRAVQGGAIEFIMQSEGPTLTSPSEVHLPAAIVPMNVPKATGTDLVKPPIPRNVAPKGKAALKRGPSQDPMNLINAALQRVYRDHKIKMPKTSQEWEVVPFGGGTGARLTIRLPSGKWKSYGTALEYSPPTNGLSRRTYSSPKEAKKQVSTDAVRAGVLDFIKSEELNAAPAPVSGHVPVPTPVPIPASTPVMTHAPAVEKEHPKICAPLPSYVALSSYVAFDPETTAPNSTISRWSTSRRSLAHALPPRPSFFPPPLGSAIPVPPQPQTSGPQLAQAAGSPKLAEPHSEIPKPQDSASQSPVDEVEAVDDLLGPVTHSRPDSAIHGASDEEDQLKSDQDEHENARLEDERSEPMDLESDAGTPARVTSLVSNSNRKLLPNVDEARASEEPPRKRQKTGSPTSPVRHDDAGPNIKVEEPRVMQGTSYSNILSEFCSQTGREQPQVTYQRHSEDSTRVGSVMYRVSIIVGTGRYELSKNYEDVQVAEEKLSKRILRQFGVRAKKV